jgi:molybdopterin-guanine dinucleotide biosynthesis protein A
MGADKALLELGGKPLIAHAVTKLRRLCKDVRILSGDAALAAYAPLVSDLHRGCGPIGGIEAALAGTRFEWNLFLPVDMPFVPSALLDWWVRGVTGHSSRGRVALFRVFGRPQPALLLIHRDAVVTVSAMIARGEYRLMTALEAAAGELAGADAPSSERVPYMLPVDENMRFEGWDERPSGPGWWTITEAQKAAQGMWFMNLNTPEEFAEAEGHVDALDT